MNTPIAEKSSWIAGKCDLDRAAELAGALSIHPITSRLLLYRGISSPESAERFFSPGLDSLHDPFLFNDMDRAVSRILVAIDKKEKIVIYGDYDLDGITGTALYVELFKELGHPADSYIPHRIHEGYGRLSPYGPSNPEPIFSVNQVRLLSLRKGGRSVQFKIRKEGGLTFNVSGPEYLLSESDWVVEGSLVDLAFTPRVAFWQGEERIFLTLKGIRAAGSERESAPGGR